MNVAEVFALKLQSQMDTYLTDPPYYYLSSESSFNKAAGLG